MCHVCIYLDVHHIHGNVNELLSWTDYLFPNLEGTSEEIQVMVADEDIEAIITVSNYGNVLLEDEGIDQKSDKFKSFHHQAS